MNNRPLLRRAVRHALLAGVALSTAGYAHIGSAQQAGAERAVVDEITVTGSRLRRDRDFVEVSPVQTVEFEQIQASGNVTLESTLNKFPQLAPDTTSATNQSGGQGVLTANLRGLGAVRTLVLVDGRRFVPADGTGLTDLAAIPDILIERIEIVTGGASSIYGSDAVAGAVNFITRQPIDGMEVRYQFGQASKRDGTGNKIDVLMGGSSDRGSAMLHLGYAERDSVFMGDRGFSSQPLLANAQGILLPFGVQSIPETFVGVPSAFQPQIQGVDFAGAAASCPEGAPGIQGLRFEPDGTPAAFCRSRDQFNYAAPNFLLRPLSRWQVSALGSYDVSENIEWYAQGFYVKKENAFQQAPLNTTPTTPGAPNGTLLIRDAAVNPLFQPALRDFFAANEAYFDPDGTGVSRVSGVQRRFNEFGPRNSNFVADSVNMATGLRGDIEIGNRNWDWDTFVQFARSDLSNVNQGQLSFSRLSAALNVELVDGEPRCVQDLLNCVPVNIFGEGSLNDEMVNYIRTSTSRNSAFTRAVAGASATGDLFQLPAGPVPLAFGVEWRRESFADRPDGVLQAGDTGGTPAQVVNGNFNIAEFFVETRIPLLEGLPGIESLALEGAARYADYSSIGSVLAWSTSLDWAVTGDLRLRGGFSRAIRAPSLEELNRPVSAGFRGGVDPCLAANNPTDAQKALCVAQGVPAALIDTLQLLGSEGFFVETGGNQGLLEEEADTLTAGLVYTPEFLSGLSLAIDFYRIKLERAIAEVAFQPLVNSCFATLDINGTACQSITRNDFGNIDRVRAPLLNVASRRVEGLDAQISYTFDQLPSWLSLPGRDSTLSLSMVNSWQFENTTVPFQGAPELECAGRYGSSCSADALRISPGFRSLVRANWRSGNLRITPELRYVGRLKQAVGAFPNENGTVSSWIYADLTGGYDITDSISIYGGVTNVFDKQPPVLGFRSGGDSNTNVQLYDVLGRSYFLGVNVGFGGR